MAVVSGTDQGRPRSRSTRSLGKGGPAPVKHSFRGDLEGLRAVAVLAVVADHLIHFPSGGFVGVDVFFVLSGYLITGLLLREIDKTGHISFADFYRRRIRRILPAATLVLVATVVASYLVFRISRASGIFGDAVWAALFAGNWQQAFNGTDYMNAGGAKSPLQHYWSLGVEEQFYVVWPLLILALVWAAAKLRLVERGRLLLIGGGLGVVVVVSFIFSLWETSTHPTVAYFSTFSRGWELGLGALLAVAAPVFYRLATRTRVIVGWSGLALILVAMLQLGPGSTFPGPWALLPVAGSMLVIIAGLGSADPAYSRGMVALTNPLSRYFGKISFSLYLWHFPVIILLQPMFPAGSRFYYVVAVVLMMLLSIASYHLVEDPIRRSQWLEPRLHLDARRVRPSRRVARNRTIAIAAAMGVALLTSAAFLVNAQQVGPVAAGPGPKAPVQVVAPPTTVPQDGSAQDGSAQDQGPVPVQPDALIAQQAAIAAAIAAPKWPALTPDLDQFGNAGEGVKAAEWVKDGCLGSQATAKSEDLVENTAHCVYGDANAKHSLVVYGDSVAISYLPGIRAALDGQGWKIHVFTVAGCPVSGVAQTMIGGAAFPECDAFRSWAVDEITKVKPDLVVMSEYRYDPVLISHATGAAADVERAAGYEATLGKLAAVPSKLLLLSAPPEGQLLASCATRMSSPANCLASPTPQFERTVALEGAAMARLGSKASYVDTTQWFCKDNVCPAFINSAPMHADQYHLTDAGARQLAPLLAQAMGRAMAKG